MTNQFDSCVGLIQYPHATMLDIVDKSWLEDKTSTQIDELLASSTRITATISPDYPCLPTTVDEQVPPSYT